MGSNEPAGPRARSPKQGGSKQGAPKQGGPKQGAPKQGGSKQGGPKQGGPKQGGPKRGAPKHGASKGAHAAKPARSAGATRPPEEASSTDAPKSLLGVLVDGAPLDDAAARALWIEFSAYLDEHRNDFEGFAKQKGYASVRPEHRQGRALLVVTR